MKRKFTKLLAAIALLTLFILPSTGWGQTKSSPVTYTFSDHYSEDTDLNDVAIEFDNVITATFSKGSGSTNPKYYKNGTAVRWYAKGTLVIEASNATISQIVISYTRNDNTVTANVGNYSLDNSTGTWTKPTNSTVNSVTFTEGGTNGHNRISAIEVTYVTSGPTQLTAPTNFTATAGNAQATFSWTAVENASNYTIFAKNGDTWDNPTTLFDNVSLNNGEYIGSGLSNGTTYVCKVRANGDGTSYSNSGLSESTATFTPTDITYTVTLDAGNGTVNNATTFDWNVSMNSGNLPDAVPQCNTWSFYGWSTAAASTQTTTAPTCVNGTGYTPTNNITLYAVYSKTESSGPAFNGTTSTGSFLIYATVSATNHYATGTGSKINSTTNASEATSYTFEQPSGYNSGEFAIKTGNNYITYSSSTNLGTSSDPYKWTISEGAKGTWRLTSETSGRGFIFRAGSSNLFGGYSTGNVTANGTEYYDLEIGGASTTYYHSTPDCMETVATPTFDVNEGTYYEPQIIIIECETADASIYYTLNGEEPTSTESATNFLYDENEGVEISSTTTLKAKAFKTGMNPSATRTATYTIIHDVAEPTLAESQLFTTDTYSVAITVPANTTVYYTTDGTAPTNASTQYTAAFNINATTTVKAIAYDADGCASDVVTATFTRAYTLAAAKALYVDQNVPNITISLTGVQFIAKSGSSTYMQQGTTGLMIYGSHSQDLTNGDVFTAGTVTGNVTKYGENLELSISSGAFANVAKTAGTLTASATGVGIDDITGGFSTYESRYVTLESLEMDITGLELSDGTNTLAIYDPFNILDGATQPDDNVFVTGVVTSYYKNSATTYQIIPLALTDITTGLDAELPALDPVGGADAANAVSTANVKITPATGTTVDYVFGSGSQVTITQETTVDVPSTEAVSLTVMASRDFYEDNMAEYYYKSNAASYTVYFYENGELTYYEDNVVSGTSLAISSTTAPNGFEFMGWTTAAISGVQAGAPATLYNGSVTVEDNLNLYAVYALAGETHVTYTLVGANDVTAGTYLIGALRSESATNDFYFADGTIATDNKNNADMNTNTTAVTIEEVSSLRQTAVLPTDAMEFVFSGNATDGFSICKAGTTDYLGYTATTSRKLAFGSSYNETLWKAVAKDEPLLTNGIILQTSNYKVSENSTGQSAIRGYGSNAYRALYLFKKAETATYNNYCTSVTILSGNISGTKTGANSIDANSGATIKTGTVLTAAVLGNADPNALEIENGAQLITDSKGVQATVVKHINQYTGDRDNYYLLASPIKGEVAADDVDKMLTGSYDLYYFDQDQEGEEWQNYRVSVFDIANGNGYLYANNTAIDLEFSGELVPSNENVTIPLTFTAQNGPTFNGWNLVGNPFACNASSSITDFYRINGSVLEAASGVVSPCEAIFVKATAANENVTFSKAVASGANNNSGILNVNLMQASTRSNSRLDMARVRFGQGNVLEKLDLFQNDAKIYLPQDGKEYAVVYSSNVGEMPVNFKAAENGTYTIDVEAENLDVNYLHLIDNITGMDVDLLATPSYTFEARKSDIASRFRLVFDANTGNDETNDNFAFINNGELIVNGNGTVQVIDILGRQMFSHEVNSSFRIQNSEFAPGVYVLRLVNGNDVKTQKIVIK